MEKMTAKNIILEGKIKVKTLCECGEWYMENFDITPASTLTALSDWLNEDRKSIWYSSRFWQYTTMTVPVSMNI